VITKAYFGTQNFVNVTAILNAFAKYS